MASERKKRFHPILWWLTGIAPMLALMAGCNPGMLSMLIMPFVDDRIPPRCKLAKKGEEVTVVIYADFARREVPLDLEPAATELSDLLAAQLKKRIAVNKEKVTIVPSSKVRSFRNQHLTQAPTAHEVGKHFKADYVISLEIGTLTLYPPNSEKTKTLYFGQTDIDVVVTAMKAAEGEGPLFSEVYQSGFPRSGPQDSGGISAVQFRSFFMNKVARDMSRWFTAFPKEERLDME